MLDFFYGVERYYTNNNWGSELFHLAGLYIISDKYRVAGMKDDVLRHFRRTLVSSRRSDGSELAPVLRRLWDNLPSVEDPIFKVFFEFVVCCKSRVLRQSDMEALVMQVPGLAVKTLGVFQKWCCQPAKNRSVDGRLIPERSGAEPRMETGQWEELQCRCDEAWEKMRSPRPGRHEFDPPNLW